MYSKAVGALLWPALPGWHTHWQLLWELTAHSSQLPSSPENCLWPPAAISSRCHSHPGKTLGNNRLVKSTQCWPLRAKCSPQGGQLRGVLHGLKLPMSSGCSQTVAEPTSSFGFFPTPILFYSLPSFCWERSRDPIRDWPRLAWECPAEVWVGGGPLQGRGQWV